LRTLLKRKDNGVEVQWQRQLLPLPPKSAPPP
jgi:hypothetical protein